MGFNALLPQGDQHISKRGLLFLGIPGRGRELPCRVSLGGEPQQHQTVQQHGYGSGSLDAPTRPTGRFFKSKMLLGALERDFDSPAHAVPLEHLLVAGFGRLKVQKSNQ